MATQIKLRRDSAQNWTTADPVLALGEPGIETDTNKFKFGDGQTPWTNLAYYGDDFATTTYVDNSISNVIGGAPALLNTLQELSSAINADPSFFSTISTQLDNKANITDIPSLTGYATESFVTSAIENIPDVDLTSYSTTAYVDNKSDWANISNKPTFSTVATSGEYKDLIWPVYQTIEDLPNPATNHGMFAHVHSEGHGYMAHAGIWVKLSNYSDIPTGLDGLSDVAITSATTGQILKYNGTAWVNDTDATAGVVPGADGKSAYEVAVTNGFVGDAAAWLASLVGTSGAPGADGLPGAPGADGLPGAPGVGVPVGGTTGQVLAKVDNTDYNTQWVNQTGGSTNTGNITFTGDNIGSSNNIVSITATNYVELNTGDSYIWTEASNASIQVGGARWTFSDPAVDGSSSNLIEAPNGVYTRSGDTVNCDPNMDTVIYASTYANQHTLKLLLCIEGLEGEQTNEDTQSCEMVVAKSIRNDSIAGTVYGLVYTSTLPLATLSARWNTTTSRIEITCRPNSTTNQVVVHSTVTELSSARL